MSENTMIKKEMTKDTRRLADVVEVVADATSVGKTTTAHRVCHIYRDAGRPVTLVQIESGRRRAAETGAADQTIFIETEEFATAATRTGGLSGVLTQLWDVLVKLPETGGAVVVDWAGGTASHRLDVVAATAYDTTLASLGISGTSLVLATCAAESMHQASRYLKTLAQVAPVLRRSLVLSGRAGGFDFASGSEQAEGLARLKAVAGKIPVITIPHVAGRALEICADAGLDVATAMMTDIQPLGRRLGIDIFRAASCASELALWWKRSGVALIKALEVPDDGNPAA
ncbi:hypothetical protein [Bradyrhizobium arachidis]|uniref:hypothetical protein n=1 Tax=Bradyrhizobium arachidis TaxID=858423 RepID=UPI002161601B|nr:hypothetical protein [Bradyrhizobium arachidis]UVO26945.1 hypothetical protein KUF59_30970 [Bradyrhizobium arachidis]